MLHDLLRIKKIREHSAKDLLMKSKHILQEKKDALIDYNERLIKYIAWRSKEETILYDNILNTGIKQKDLDKLKQKIAKLREKDITLEEAIEKTKNEITEAKTKLNEAEQAYHEARRAVDKFDEFTSVIDQEDAKEAQRLEDAELDEFITKKNK